LNTIALLSDALQMKVGFNKNPIISVKKIFCLHYTIMKRLDT
jgi:hypothetical protein